MIVVDTSILFEVIGQTEVGRLAAGQFRKSMIHAPHIIDVEFASALRRHVRLGGISLTQASLALQDLREMRLVRHPHYPMLDRIWSWRNNFSAYDASYLALAEELGATLMTRDVALASARLRKGKVVLA